MGEVNPSLPDGWDAIPDPAASVARRAAPAPTLPAEPSLTRVGRQRRALLCAALALAWLSAPLLAFPARRDIGQANVLAPILLWTLTSALALGITLRPRARGLPAGVRAIQLVVGGVLAAFVLAVLAVSTGAAEVPIHLTEWRGGAGCFSLTSLMGVGPLVLAAIALRRSFPSAPALRGAALGVIAGLAGAIGIHVLCPLQARGHLLVTHGAPIVLLTIAGAALGALAGRP